MWDKINPEANTEKLVILPGFEVAQTRKRPVTSIITWVHCFSRYTAAMAKQFPECTPGFMSHLLTVLKAYREVEEPAWRLYDEAFQEKMASTGPKPGQAWMSRSTRSCQHYFHCFTWDQDWCLMQC